MTNNCFLPFDVLASAILLTKKKSKKVVPRITKINFGPPQEYKKTLNNRMHTFLYLLGVRWYANKKIGKK